VSVFTHLLKKKNHTLSLYDIDTTKAFDIAKKWGCKSINSLQEITNKTDALMICTPLEKTPEIINEILDFVTDNILIEIASLKKRTVPLLQKSPKSVRTISIHPMFGPDIDNLKDKMIITVPVKNQTFEEKFTKKLFPEANHTILDMDTHDKFMSLILALPYFINLVFLKCLPVGDLDLIKKLAGPTFRTQYALAECILDEEPQFVKSLIEDNVFVRDNLNDFVYEFKYLRRLLKNKPTELNNYFQTVKKSINTPNGFINSRKLRNLFLDSIQTMN
jgi:prephenate dehydrogenase